MLTAQRYFRVYFHEKKIERKNLISIGGASQKGFDARSDETKMFKLYTT